jgi:heptosyltransferase III
MHLAAALDKPQVVLFGPTRIADWAPLSDRAVCLYYPGDVNQIPQQEIITALESIL